MMADLFTPEELASYRTPTDKRTGRPVDPRLFLTLMLIDRSDGSHVDDDDGHFYVRGGNTKLLWRQDLALFDELLERKWIAYPDHETVEVTALGRYWSGRFEQMNPLPKGTRREQVFEFALARRRASAEARFDRPPAGAAGGPAADGHVPVPLVAVAAHPELPLRRFLATRPGAAAGG